MRTIADTDWGKKRVSDNGISKVTTYTLRKTAADIGLGVVGGAAMYGLGLLAGDLLDQVPDVKDILPTIVNHLSGIDVRGNLDGLVGLIGAFYGFATTGLKLNDDTMLPEKIVTPIIDLELH